MITGRHVQDPLIPLPWEEAPCDCGGDCGPCTANFGKPALRAEAVGAPLRHTEFGVGIGATFVGWPVGIENPQAVLFASGAFAPLSANQGALQDDADLAELNSPWPTTIAQDGVSESIGPRFVTGAPPIDVDLYVATTLPDDDTSLRNSGECDMDEWTGCNLVRIRLRGKGVGATIALDVIQRMDRFGGRSWPAISPDRRHLAYVRKSPGNGDAKESRLYVRDLTTWDLIRVDRGDCEPGIIGNGRPLFPAWFGPNFLLWSASQTGCSDEGPSHSDWATFGAAIGTTPVRSSGQFWLLGPDTAQPNRASPAGPTPTNFADPEVLRPDTATVAGLTDMRVVTHGSLTESEPDDRDPKPRVSPASHLGGAGAPTEEFVLGWSAKYLGGGDWSTSAETRPITECHHPAWSTSGAEIACHAHLPSVRFNDDPTAAEPLVKLTYTYRRAGSVWGNPVLAFDPGSPDSLQASLGAGMPKAVCVSEYSYKQAEFCLADGYMILTLFCRGPKPADDPDAKGLVTRSRVLIVRREPLRIWDVTGWIESLTSATEGTLRSQVGTCGTPP